MPSRPRVALALLCVVALTHPLRAAAAGVGLPSFERILEGIPASDASGPLARPWLGGFEKARPQFGDADGDGDEDLFVFEDIGRLRLYRNDGPPAAPQFAFQTDDWTGLHDYYFGRVVDIDVDGDLDLFVQAPDFLTSVGGVDVFAPGAYLYTNVGTAASPVFQNLSAHPAGYVTDAIGDPIPMVTTSPDFVDLEGDGDQDLLFGDPTGAFFLYRNVGSPASASFQFESDHYDDLLVVFGSCGSSRAEPVPLSHFLRGPSLRHGYMLLSFFDLEGDTRPDLFLGDQFNSNVYYIKNQGGTPNPHFTCETQSYFPQQLTFEQNLVATFTDLDADADPDVLLGSGTSSFTGLFQFRNDGSPSAPTFSLAVPNFLPEFDAGRNSAPCFADLDGGGLPDLFIGAQGAEGQLIQFWNNVGTSLAPAFALEDSSWVRALSYGWAVPEFADLDGDSRPELFVGTFSGAVRWFRIVVPEERLLDQSRGGGAGVTKAAILREVRNDPAFGVPGTKRINARLDFNAVPRFIDDDGDGDLDLVLGSWKTTTPIDTRLVFFRNDGTPQQPDMVFVTNDWRGLGSMGQGLAPAFGDLDGDGDKDLLVGRVEGTLACFVNEGTPTLPMFVPGPDPFADIDIGGDPVLGGSVPFLVDLDGDADMDLAVGELGGGLNLFRNIGPAGPVPSPVTRLDPPAGAVPQGHPQSFTVAARPVPSRAEVTITLAIPNAGHTKVEVFDTAGRRVATLWDGSADVGERAFVWTGRDATGRRAAPGIYFVRATLGDQVASKRVVLLH